MTSVERADAYQWLSLAERQLFETMMLRDQQHGVVVLRRVRESSLAEDQALFAAALLHDCGKGRVALWQRVVHVLAPPFERKLAQETGADWRQAFWRLRYHPDIGADMAVRAGSDAETVRLIGEQDQVPQDARLALLQAADNG